MNDNLGNLWGTEAKVWSVQDANNIRKQDTLPEDTGAERAFLGCLLMPGNEQFILESTEYMDPNYFAVPQYGLAYRAAVECVNAGIEVSPISIANQMGPKATHIGGFTGLVEMVSSAVDYRDPKPLGKIIKDKWQARQAMKALDKARRSIGADGEVGGSLDGLMSLLGALAPQQESIVSHSDLLDLAASGVPILPNDLASNRPHFGIPFIDLELNATSRRLGVIAAKTSAGKSSISYQICVQSAAKGRRVLLVSLESDKEEVASALAANMSGMSRSDIMRRGTHGFDSHLLNAVKANVSGFYAGSGATWERLDNAIRAEHRRRPFDVVIVDYFTLLNPPEYKGRNMASLYGEISKASKRLAQELECSVILLSQFNRGVEDGQEPHLENLRETGQLEQDADWALLLWAKAEDEADGTRIVYAKGAKNRGGKRGFKGKMTFYPAQSRFEPNDTEIEITEKVKTILKKRKDN